MTFSTVAEFLEAPGVVIDVRSPGEFAQGAISGALNLPLFSDEERAEVGTLYKQEGEEAAVNLGLQRVGPKMSSLLKNAKEASKGKPLKIYCWRGGMRSRSVATFLQNLGLPAATLTGGYKAFRRWALETLSEKKNVVLLGGFTGCGKTEILHALKQSGEQVLDLEGLANHRGSSFGAIGMGSQPTTEAFQNRIAMQWSAMDSGRRIWVEDESRMVGTCEVPEGLFSQMLAAPLVFIDRPREERLQILNSAYGEGNPEEWIDSVKRIERRLGSQRAQEVVADIESGNLRRAAEQVLDYYDSAYEFTLKKRRAAPKRLQGENLSAQEWAQRLILECAY